MILRLYAGVTRVAAPSLSRMLGRRVRRGKEIAQRLPERKGFASLMRPPGRLVWVHAASVGETMSALPLIEELAKQCWVLLTTGTVTSARLAADRLPDGALHQFVPLDVPRWGKRFLDYWRPQAAVFIESELWPNLLLACDKQQIPRFLVNARVSATSMRHWRRFLQTAGRLLGGFVAIHAQSAADAARFQALGAKRLLEWGNLKFAAPALPCSLEALTILQRNILGPVWLAASTHAGEEEMVYTAHKALLPAFPRLVTIIVPRHPERGAQIATLCGGAPRRSMEQVPLPGAVYVADTLGELGVFFRLAPFVFMGNSLIAGGGHNVIEPAKLARPVICGPHMENFVEATDRLINARALTCVHTVDELVSVVSGWLVDSNAACEAGIRAREAVLAFEELPKKLAALVGEVFL